MSGTLVIGFHILQWEWCGRLTFFRWIKCQGQFFFCENFVFLEFFWFGNFWRNQGVCKVKGCNWKTGNDLLKGGCFPWLQWCMMDNMWALTALQLTCQLQIWSSSSAKLICFMPVFIERVEVLGWVEMRNASRSVSPLRWFIGSLSGFWIRVRIEHRFPRPRGKKDNSLVEFWTQKLDHDPLTNSYRVWEP